MRCTRAEAWLFGYYVVKYDTEDEPVKKPLLGVRKCPEESVVTFEREGLTYHWCEAHAKGRKP